MNAIDCRCGVRMEWVDPPPRTVTCMCGTRHVWTPWNVQRYVADPVCRDCDAPALAYRNGDDEAVFFCEAHERARWAYP